MFDFFERMSFGTRVFAQGKWWTYIQYLRNGFYLVADSKAIMPAPILLVKQSDKDALYQKILFKRFIGVK